MTEAGQPLIQIEDLTKVNQPKPPSTTPPTQQQQQGQKVPTQPIKE